MKSFPQQEVSLYELLLKSENPPQALQISPTIFKTMVASFIDLLIEQKIPATLWVKLPRGSVWQSEINRYQVNATVPYTVYMLNGSKDPGEAAFSQVTTEGVSQSPLGDIDDETTAASLPDPMFSRTAGSAPNNVTARQSLLTLSQNHVSQIDVPQTDVPETEIKNTPDFSLNIGQQLRREYFILVLSGDFSGLLLAHRPRNTRQSRNPAKAASTEELERKHPLLALCSFDPQTIQQVIQGIEQAVKSTVPTDADPTGPEQSVLTSIEELLKNWDNLTALEIRQSLNPQVLSYLLTQQIRNLEEVWHSSAGYRRQAESAEALRLENEALQNAVRSKDEFLKNVGQELRTPLSTMKTALKLLNSPNLRPNQRQRYMDMLEQECDRQGSLITSVLDLIQLETDSEQTSLQPIRVADVVPGVVSTYQPLAQEKGILLTYHIAEDLPAISFSSQALRQIAINLLHNGIKFTPPGGRVWVRAKRQGSYVQLNVEDTGIGIASTDIPRIFERFYRIRHGSEDAHGAGLGLSIVQQLLLRSGGSITVKSEPGEGATFTVLLPVHTKA